MRKKNQTRKILFSLTGFCLLAIPFFTYALECGDVNASGNVNIVDALMTAQYSVGKNPEPFDSSVADVNASDSVDILDALVIAHYSVGIVSALSCPGPQPTPGTNPVYSTGNGKFYCDGSELVLYGLNWFGMETSDNVLHGLWTGRQLDDFLADFVSKGFNALRLPVSPHVIKAGYPIDSGPYSGNDCAAICGLDGRAGLEYTLERCLAAGMFVLLDFHTCDPANLGSGLPGNPFGCSGYSQADWLEDLGALANLSLMYPNVMGIDLCNEPYDLSYTEWASLASRGGQVVLGINPDVTIWVEGVGNNSPTAGYPANWGQNLYGAGPISGIPADRLVFSPHSYGPSVAAMDYFEASHYPDNMPEVWDSLFGYLIDQGYTVITGEFGGHYTTSSTPSQNDKLWQDSFIAYLKSKGVHSSFYWCVNPNSGDTGGIYSNDWKTWNTAKLQLLQSLMK